jgi:predicted metal-binding membrane protein
VTSHLTRRATFLTVAVLVGLATLAWALTVKQALDMSAMVTGLGQVGARMPNDMAAPLFMAMWLTMMVAMMFPTIAPVVLAHHMVVAHRGEGSLPTMVFVLGYLVVWTAIGMVPLALFLAFRNLSMEAAESNWLPIVAGGVLVGAGLYQFTPLKGVCLKACRSPLSFIMTHDFGSGAPGAFRAGVLHGVYCVGCCWALLSVLLVMGLMNLVWMAALSLVFLAEKNWRRGPLLGKLAGSLVALLGAAVIFHPALLSSLAG